MSWLRHLFRRKPAELEFDPQPRVTAVMPARPYRILHAGLPFFSDPECREEVSDARLLIIQTEDPHQATKTIECMPTRLHYRAGQLVGWDLNYKKLWESAYYRDPESGDIEKAFSQSVEFIGSVVEEATGTGAASHTAD